MRVEPVAIEVEHVVGPDGDARVERAPLPGPVADGPAQARVSRAHADQIEWEVAGTGAVRAVRLVFRVEATSGPVRLLRQGYQSWSATGVATLGVDRDPSNGPDVPRLVRGMHHADEEVARPGDLRSEMVTVLTDDAGRATLVGFLGGTTHDGTLRLRQVGGGVELVAEAYLGGACLDGVRHLHDVVVREGPDASDLLEAWAREVGRLHGARTTAPYQVGWCSWYHYFHGVTEADLRSNLALAREGGWPFDVFQLDDGFQRTIGDWLTTNERFPSGIAAVADDVAAAGFTPGIWIAPFLVAPDSTIAVEHPDWIAGYGDGSGPLIGMWNPGWGGATFTLDTTHPEVLDHLEQVARSLVEAGYPYLKLDFTYAPSLTGVYHDPTRTPAERVRAGYDAIRRGAGDDAFLLGCGAPLGAVVGVVDGNRIGADVAPAWATPAQGFGDYVANEPATRNAYGNTVARAWMHRRLWLNDPDCLMLRQSSTELDEEAMRAWAATVAVSGGMALVSDDLSLLGAGSRQLFDEVLAIGRAADAATLDGRGPRCPDLMVEPTPHVLESAGHRVVVDPDAGVALETPLRGHDS